MSGMVLGTGIRGDKVDAAPAVADPLIQQRRQKKQVSCQEAQGAMEVCDTETKYNSVDLGKLPRENETYAKTEE